MMIVVFETPITGQFEIKNEEKGMFVYDLPLLEVGNHTDRHGTKVDFDEEFLKKAVEYSNSQLKNRAAYFIKGHKDENVAFNENETYGHVVEYEYRDGKVYSKKAKIYDDKAPEISSGKMQGVSAKVDLESGEIYHVAFVGRQAIPSASLNNAKIVTFEQSQGGEMAEDKKTVELSMEAQAKIAELEAQLQDNEKKRTAELEEYAKKVQALELAAQEAEAKGFIELQLNEGNILPAQKEFAVNIAKSELRAEFEKFLELNKRVDFSQNQKFTELSFDEKPENKEAEVNRTKELAAKVAQGKVV